MKDKNLKSQVMTGMFWRFGERICAQLVTFVVSIVLARLLEPSHYGVISLLTVFIAIANVFVSDGFGKALIQKKKVNDCDYSSVFYFNILFSWFVYVVIFFLAPSIASFYKEPILTPTLRVLAFKIPLAGINSIQQAYVARNMIFKKFFWSTLIGTIISAVVGIVMAMQGFGVWALVAQYLTNSLIDTIVLWFTVRWRPKLQFSIHRLLNLLKFGWKILLTSLINTGYDNLRSMIIGKVYSSIDLAYYTKGIHYPNLIIVNVNTTIGSVLFPALSKLQDDKFRLKQGLRKAIAMSTYVIFPLMAGLAAVAPEVVSLMLTDKWLPCVPFLRIACVYMAFYPINTANLQAIMAAGKSDVYLKLNIIKKGIGLIVIFATIPFGVMAMAAGEIVVALAAVLTNISANKKMLNYGIKDLWGDVGANFVMSLLVYVLSTVCGNVISHITDQLFIILAVKVLLGVITYLIMSIVVRSQEMQYIFKMLKRTR